MSKDACLIKLQDAFSGKVTKKFLQETLDAVDDLKTRYPDPTEFMKNVKEFYQNRQFELSLSQKNRVENAIKLNRELLNYESDANFRENPIQFLESIIVGTNMKGKGVNRSIEIETGVLSQQHKSMLIYGLEKNKLLQPMLRGEYDLEIMKLAKDRNAQVSANAKKAFEVIDIIDDSLLENMKLAGSYKRKLSEGFIRRNYSPDKLIKAKKSDFVEFMRGNLDEERMVKYGIMRPGEDLTKGIESVYDEVISGTFFDKMARSKDVNLAPLEAGGVTKTKRIFHLKSAEAEIEFMSKFTDGNLIKGVLSNIEGSSKDSAVFRRLGTNPVEAWDTLKQRVAQNASVGGTDEAGKAVSASAKQVKNYSKLAKKHKRLDALFTEVVSGKPVALSSASKAVDNIRALTRMAKLGLSAPTAFFTDIGTAAVNMNRMSGKGLFSAQAEALTNTLGKLSSSKRAEVGEKLGFYFQSALGDHHSRITNGDKVGGNIAKMQEVFFKANGMDLQTGMQKTASANELAHVMAEVVTDGKIHPNMKVELARYDITDLDLKNLQKAIIDVNGTQLVDRSRISEIDVTPPKGMSVAEYKSDLNLKYGAFILDNVNFESPTPGAKQNIFTRGLDPDSASGIAARLMQDFKTFAMKMGDNLEKHLLSDPNTKATSLGEAVKGAATDPLNNLGAIQRMGAMAGVLTFWGFLGMQTQELLKGRTPRPLTDPSTYKDAFIKGGAGGLWLDFLMGDYNSRFRNLSGDIMGPTGSTLSDMAEIGAGMMRNEASAAGTFSKIWSNLPFNNLLYTKAALDMVFLDNIKESLSPGYTKRQKASLKERGQARLIGD